MLLYIETALELDLSPVESCEIFGKELIGIVPGEALSDDNVTNLIELVKEFSGKEMFLAMFGVWETEDGGWVAGASTVTRNQKT